MSQQHSAPKFDIDAEGITMADVEKYIAEMDAASAQSIAQTKRMLDAHAVKLQKQAIENSLYGRSRIAYALSQRK